MPVDDRHHGAMTISERRRHFMEAVGDHLPASVYFHGTTPENAASIAENGFHLDNETHGRSAGEGVYLHKDPLVAGAHGDAIVAVKLSKGTRIANRTDTTDATWHAIRDQSSGGSFDERMTRRLQDWDFHGHTDVDDGSTIVHDPARVQYVKHYARPAGFGPQDWERQFPDGH